MWLEAGWLENFMPTRRVVIGMTRPYDAYVTIRMAGHNGGASGRGGGGVARTCLDWHPPLEGPPGRPSMTEFLAATVL